MPLEQVNRLAHWRMDVADPKLIEVDHLQERMAVLEDKIKVLMDEREQQLAHEPEPKTDIKQPVAAKSDKDDTQAL